MVRSTPMAVLALVAAGVAPAQTPHRADATAPAPSPTSGYLNLGTATAPNGDVLGINNQYLTYNGKPWMPVMGEIHYVRLPEDEWDAALARIKASGVDIVASYFFWNYHEETPGAFDWSGRRDVRRFVELAAKHDLKVVVRIGPWGHGEVRYGGIPDWVVRSMPTRASDPTYMGHVDRYWAEIGRQLKGLYWKDGGPIIGVQLENEYNLTGPQQGREHIADLKALAIRHGMDTPFYTVTGWDGAVYPTREVVPVFGGYPDEPWSRSPRALPPKETYVFRFDSRVSGNLGAQTRGRGGDADGDIPNTPFLGAEYGGGVPTMYRRRPVIAPDDIAAMLPVQLGSGVNLYGYYMYHGGSNLIGRTTLEEATAIGGHNDLPVIDYDFQAPFGAFGQANPVAAAIRPFHLMMRSYGDALAPATVRKPVTVPRGNDDLTTLRWSVRAKDDAAFVFVNNHVRQYPMAAQTGTRFSVALPGGTVTFPSRGVTVPDGAYFIWPVGLDLGGQVLAWASAQPVSRIDSVEGPVHVFAATDGIVPEFAFAAGTRVTGGQQANRDGRRIVRVARPGTDAVLTVRRPGAAAIRIVVLTQAQARKLWRADVAGEPHFILSDDQLAAEGEALSFTSTGDADFGFSAWPALPGSARGNLSLSAPRRDGMFMRYTARAPERRATVTVRQIRAPGTAAPLRATGPNGVVVQPYPETFGPSAGAWALDLPVDVLRGVDDAFLRIDWAGDVGRLFAGEDMIEDSFFDGRRWLVGLKRHRADLGKPLTLRVSPLRGDAPVYLDAALKPKLAADQQIADIRLATIVPQYRLTVRFDR